MDRHAPTAVVLQAPTDVVGLFVVEGDLIELPNRNNVHEIPGLSGVVAPVTPAIRPREHMIRVRRVYPHGVIIPVDSAHALRRKRLSTVLGIKHLRAKLPDAEVIVGVDANLAVVRRPWIRIAHFLPSLAFVVAAKSPALLLLHDGVDDVRS